MGHLSAMDMAAHADLDTALSWHLRSNHYPPVPTFMIPLAKAAIEAFNDGEPDRVLELPQGCTTHREVHATTDNRLDDTCALEPAVTWRESAEVVAAEVVDSFHLDAFLD